MHAHMVEKKKKHIYTRLRKQRGAYDNDGLGDSYATRPLAWTWICQSSFRL